MARTKINEQKNHNTKGFATQKQNINRKGQPRKTISSVNIELEANGITEATTNDIKSCYLRLINIDLNELKKMVGDETQPAMIRIVGKSILSGKGFDVIEKMLDRSIGKAQSNIDVTSNGNEITNNIDVSKLSTQTLLELKKAYSQEKTP
mgnify:CR=1 FL=1